MTEDEKEAEKILAGQQDFEFKLAYEVIPSIEIGDYSSIKVTRPVYDVPEDEIDQQVNRVAESARSYEAKDGSKRYITEVVMNNFQLLPGQRDEAAAA